MWRDTESKEDFLNFSELAEQIVALITNKKLLPISIGVFGSWGTGKSTVLSLVESKLPARIAPAKAPIVVQFDAWLYQCFDDAKAALMEVVSKEIIERATIENEPSTLEKAKSFARRVNYFRALGLITEFSVGASLGIPPGLLTSAGSAISSILSGKGKKEDSQKVGSELEKLITPAEGRTPPQEIHAFRREFQEILKELDTSLILFIDNLDRCLPDVAISTLEAVRLFLFIPGTAFLIAADEDMIRHSVAKHFEDPNASHVRDYLDKVIQVPLRVPRVGVDDLRAYMYSLFIELTKPEGLQQAQEHMLRVLQGAWRGDRLIAADLIKLMAAPAHLVEQLTIADQLAPVLATAPNIQGNPRIVKRLLNSILLRQSLATKRQMNVSLSVLAKLAIFERCTDQTATLELYGLIMEQEGVDEHLMPDASLPAERPPLPESWLNHRKFVEKWRELDPPFEDAAQLRPAVFLSRDVMAPAWSRAKISEPATAAIQALREVNTVNSVAASKIVEALSAGDRIAVVSSLIQIFRDADWSGPVEGFHGALIIARQDKECEEQLRAFFSTLNTETMDKGLLYLLKNAKMLES